MYKYIALLFIAIIGMGLEANAKEQNVHIYERIRQIPQGFFYTLDGEKKTLNDFKGKFILLLNWSRYCLPCLKELSGLETFQKNIKGSSIELIMISNSNEWKNMDEQKHFLQKRNVDDLLVYDDRDGKLAASFGVFTSPHIVLINQKGHEIGRLRGAAEWDSPEVMAYILKLKEENNNR